MSLDLSFDSPQQPTTPNQYHMQHINNNINSHSISKLFAWNNEKQSIHLATIEKFELLQLIDAKLGRINLSNIVSETTDPSQQMLINFLLMTPMNLHSHHIFSQFSHYQTNDAHNYRKRATKQEVRPIPPFVHLHKQFGVDIFGYEKFMQMAAVPIQLNITSISNECSYSDSDDEIINRNAAVQFDLNADMDLDITTTLKSRATLKLAADDENNGRRRSIFELPSVIVPSHSAMSPTADTTIGSPSFSHSEIEATPILKRTANNPNATQIDNGMLDLEVLALDGAISNIKNKLTEKKATYKSDEEDEDEIVVYDEDDEEERKEVEKVPVSALSLMQSQCSDFDEEVDVGSLALYRNGGLNLL